MKPDCTSITNLEEKKRVEAKIIDEWENGILFIYKKDYPNANVDVTISANKGVDYWCIVRTEKGDLIGRYSIIGDKVSVSNLAITEIETT